MPRAGAVVAIAVVGSMLVPSSWAAADPAPTRARPQALRSTALRAARTELRRAFAALRRTAPGRRWIRDPGGDRVRVGRTYEEQAWRVAIAPNEDAIPRLVAVMRVALHPDPDDEAFYARATPIASPASPETIAATFDIEHARDRREVEAIAAFAREIARVLTRHGTVVAYAAQCGWGDAVGSAVHGVMLADRTTGELWWLHVEDVWSEG